MNASSNQIGCIGLIPRVSAKASTQKSLLYDFPYLVNYSCHWASLSSLLSHCCSPFHPGGLSCSPEEDVLSLAFVYGPSGGSRTDPLPRLQRNPSFSAQNPYGTGRTGELCFYLSSLARGSPQYILFRLTWRAFHFCPIHCRWFLPLPPLFQENFASDMVARRRNDSNTDPPLRCQTPSFAV